MLLGDLVTAIETVQTCIREHGDRLSQNEYRTRLSLIDPVLNALGWDVSNPRLVRVEDHHSGIGTPDYALLGEDGQPNAYVEAKKLGEMAGTTKPAHRSQLRDYADELQTNYAGLTDGDHWIFRDFSTGFSNESYILDVTFSNQSAHRCALQMLVLWRPNLGSGQPIEADPPILVGSIDAEPPVNTPEPPVTPPPPPPGWVSILEYDPGTDKKPPTLRFPEGKEVPLKYWYEILKETSEWLIGVGQLTTDSCPIKNNGKVSIVDTEPKHESGTSFFHPLRLSNGLWLNKHGNKGTLLTYTRILMERCGKDPASIRIKRA